MRIQTASCLFICAALSGCGSAPQTAQEFRQAVPGAMLMKTETLEVNRPFREVAETFRRKAPECLQVAVRTTSQTSTSFQVIDAEYKPTVIVTKDRAELHVQRLYKRGVIAAYKEPDGGHYLVVADAYPAGQSKTRLDIFGPSRSHEVMIRAIKGWASGENLGCPDMTKN